MQTFKKQTNTYQPGLSKKDFMLITRPITMSSQHNLFEVVASFHCSWCYYADA